MFFNQLMKEEADIKANDIDALLPQDPETEEGLEILANKVEDAMQASAMESARYFDGGEEAVNTLMESAEVQAELEAGIMNKKETYIRFSRSDDLKRRTAIAAVTLAQNNNDPLFKKLAKCHKQIRHLKSQIYKKYEKQALKVARKSQKKHITELKKHPSMPSFKK